MTTVTTTRLAWVDRLRGVAIALMVLDHVLVQVAPQHWLRYTVTRWSLPLFVGCAAVVYKGRPSRRSMVLLAVGVLAESALNSALDLGTPGPVLIIVGVMWFASVPTVQRYPFVFGTAGLLLALYRPIGPTWSGYDPGLVLAWWALGGAAVRELEQVGNRLPAVLGVIGRRPIECYVAHLLVLAVVVVTASP